jgi:hypothetical protein
LRRVLLGRHLMVADATREHMARALWQKLSRGGPRQRCLGYHERRRFSRRRLRGASRMGRSLSAGALGYHLCEVRQCRPGALGQSGVRLQQLQARFSGESDLLPLHLAAVAFATSDPSEAVWLRLAIAGLS